MREGSLTMLTQRKLSNVLGSAIEGIDLSRELADAEFCELARALWEGGVLAIKGQRLVPGQFLAFARCFGRPEPHVINQFHYPGYPDILIISNRRNNGEPIGLADAGSYFHTDYSYLEVPARLTMLYSIEVPSRGGNTLFANMYGAYDDLAESMKRRIDDLVVLHHYGNRDDLDERSRTAASPLTAEQKDKVTWVRHKLVRTHHAPAARRFTRFRAARSRSRACRRRRAPPAGRVEGHALQEKYRFSYSYEVGDVVLWDDLATLHSATLTDPNDPRTLWRITDKEPATRYGAEARHLD